MNDDYPESSVACWDEAEVLLCDGGVILYADRPGGFRQEVLVLNDRSAENEAALHDLERWRAQWAVASRR
jgi:hypothetical protein